MHEFIPIAGTSVNNPIDTMVRKPDEMERLLTILGDCAVVDAIFVNPIYSGPLGLPPADAQTSPEEVERRANEAARENARMLGRMQERTGKAFIVTTRDRGEPPPGTAVFLQACYDAGVAVYPSTARAARAVSQVRQWRARREGLPDIL
jgi:hypothetical protein